MSELAKRVATAGVLVPIVLAAIFIDPTPWSVVGLAAAVSVIGCDEYLCMALPATEARPEWSLRWLTGIIGVALVVLSSAFGQGVVPPLLAFSVLILGALTLGRKSALPQSGRHFGVCLSALLYVPLLVSTLPLLKHSGQGDWLTVSLCMAFFSDTVAYAFGLTWGRHKLYPAVSPGKTWEGSAGGIVGACLATLVVGKACLLPELPVVHAIALGILGSISGQIGDLVESMLKRTFGVKDSGTLLPGHGGMLDRVDGMLFVTPVAYYYVMLWGLGDR